MSTCAASSARRNRIPAWRQSARGSRSACARGMSSASSMSRAVRLSNTPRSRRRGCRFSEKAISISTVSGYRARRADTAGAAACWRAASRTRRRRGEAASACWAQRSRRRGSPTRALRGNSASRRSTPPENMSCWRCVSMMFHRRGLHPAQRCRPSSAAA